MTDSASDQNVPYADRDDDQLQGHWLLARLGKRVLRPGGVELTRRLLSHADPADKNVVELAPGLGRTATEIIRLRPRSYRGVDSDAIAAARVRGIVAEYNEVHELALMPDDLPESEQRDPSGADRSIRVNARPLTPTE